ncbi:MAG: LysR family transcriptional regulator [Paracoccaceae bacterium]
MRTRLSIQALEVFESVARTSSLQASAHELGLSISSVSHHVGRLEGELGTRLLDRSRRPLRLTVEGQNFVLRIREGLRLIRQARREAELGGVAETRTLRVGMVDDFEGEVGPAVALDLARALPRAALSMRTIASLEAVELIAAREIDIAVAADAADVPAEIALTPVLRDPFVSAVRAGGDIGPDGGLPLLRFSPRLLIGRQIDAQLRRVELPATSRFAFDDAASILALVSEGHGWTILTPVVFARVRRFAERIELRPLPFAAFSRRLVVLSGADAPPGLADAVAAILRQHIEDACVRPTLARFPWLGGELRVEGLSP